LPVAGSFLREYKRYLPDFSFRIIYCLASKDRDLFTSPGVTGMATASRAGTVWGGPLSIDVGRRCVAFQPKIPIKPIAARFQK